MKRIVTFLLALPAVVLVVGFSLDASAQVSRRVAFKPEAEVPTVKLPALWNAPTESPVFLSPSSALANAEDLVYMDLENTDIMKSYSLPFRINFSDAQGNITPDTMTELSQRFTSTFSKPYVNSISVRMGWGQFLDYENSWTRFSVHSQRSASGYYVPGTRLDSVFITAAEFDQANIEQILDWEIPLNGKGVAKNFFVMIKTSMDPAAEDITQQNYMEVVGDSNAVDGAQFDATVHRAILTGGAQPLPIFGIYNTQIGPSGAYYGNTSIVAHVTDAVSGLSEDLYGTGNSLDQNFPNPVGKRTAIQYSLAKSGNTSLKVYNTLGVEIASLANGYEHGGDHTVFLNTASLPAGTYFYTLRSGDFTATRSFTK